MNYRIKETNKGWIVQQQVSRWSLFGMKTGWKTFITYWGHPEPFPYQTKERAINGLMNEIKEKIECVDRVEQLSICKYVKKVGESCTLNNKCKYPNCD